MDATLQETVLTNTDAERNADGNELNDDFQSEVSHPTLDKGLDHNSVGSKVITEFIERKHVLSAPLLMQLKSITDRQT
jgi:hypothetical protein